VETIFEPARYPGKAEAGQGPPASLLAPPRASCFSACSRPSERPDPMIGRGFDLVNESGRWKKPSASPCDWPLMR